MISLVRSLVFGLGLACALTTAGNVKAQEEWPQSTIKIVVPFPAGGSQDVVARVLAEVLSEKYGQPAIVENRVGAGGNIGTAYVASAAPDGYTLSLASSGGLANNTLTYSSLPYDPRKDLAPIILVGKLPMLLIGNKDQSFNDLKSFIAEAKAKPGEMSIATPGVGTLGHLTVAMLADRTKVEYLHVPYKGGAPGRAALLAGEVKALASPVSAGNIQQINDGELVGLAIASQERFPGLPNVPTAAEQGVADFEATVSFALVGPAGIPQPVVQKINTTINEYLDSEAGAKRMSELGVSIIGGEPERVLDMMESEIALWRPIVEAAGVRRD